MNKNKKIILALLTIVLVLGGGYAIWRGSHSNQSASEKAGILYYYCPMHPNIHKDHPGQCPICNMDLVPRKKEITSSGTMAERKVNPSTGSGQVERKVGFWVDSMNPKFRSDKPGKAPDGMDLVPVYEEGDATALEVPEVLKGLSPINLTTYKQQLIGVKIVTATRQTVTRTISTVGRSADFGGGLVADVYSLDIAYVKQGQKAWITSFDGSGSRLEGVVAGLFPYDDTQSRVRRVRIALKGKTTGPYANVQIESVIPARLAVPADAVMDTGLHTYVFVQAKPGHFVPKEVSVGSKGDSFWEITSGLKDGEQVVSSANFLVDADSRLSAILQN